MATKNQKNNNKTETTSPKGIDLSKVEPPKEDFMTDKGLLDMVQFMVEQRASKNPKNPFVGVREIAQEMATKHGYPITGKMVRRRLQKIRKRAGEYKRGKSGKVVLPADKTPYPEPLTIQWVNRGDKAKGIEYIVTL